jgi:hypothetical protein
MTDVRVTGLSELTADLRKAADTAVEQTKKVVGRGCNNIKKDAKKKVTGYAHLPHYPRSIDYEVTADGTTVTGEVGPNSAKLQGGLGRVIELGTRNNSPIPHLSPALDAEEPALERYLADLGYDLLAGRPLAGGPTVDSGD